MKASRIKRNCRLVGGEDIKMARNWRQQQFGVNENLKSTRSWRRQGLGDGLIRNQEQSMIWRRRNEGSGDSKDLMAVSITSQVGGAEDFKAPSLLAPRILRRRGFEAIKDLEPTRIWRPQGIVTIGGEDSEAARNCRQERFGADEDLKAARIWRGPGSGGREYLESARIWSRREDLEAQRIRRHQGFVGSKDVETARNWMRQPF